MAGDLFSFAAHPEDGHVRVELAGELDVSVADVARERFHETRSLHPGTPFVIDLAGLTFCDSTGLGVLVLYLRTLEEAGIAMRLRGPQEPVLRIIDATGLSGLFTIEP